MDIAPIGVIEFMAKAVPAIVDIVKEQEGDEEERRLGAIAEVRTLFETLADDLYEWNLRTEEQRTRMIEGWVDTAMFVLDVEGEQPGASPKALAVILRTLLATP